MKKIAVLLLGCMAVAAFGQAPPAGTPDSVLRLREVSRIVVKSIQSGAMLGRFRCDQDANIYMRVFDDQVRRAAPLFRVSPKGEKIGEYRIASDPDFNDRGAGISDFAPSDGGEIYALAVARAGDHVVRFSKDGTIKSKHKLDTRMIPTLFVKFPTEDAVLIIGRVAQSPTIANPGTPFTAIFNTEGKLLKKVNFREDAAMAQAAERGDSEFAGPNGTGGNLAVEHGSAMAAADGNVYLVRWASPVIVYAVSPAGEIVHRYEVPVKSGSKPMAAQISKNRMALMFREPEEREAIITVIDISTGEVLANYSAKFGSAFSCYTTDPERFTFLGMSREGLLLIAAEP